MQTLIQEGIDRWLVCHRHRRHPRRDLLHVDRFRCVGIGEGHEL